MDNHLVKFLLSAEKRSVSDGFELNPVFFENWYRYQDGIVVGGGRVDLVQVFCVSFLFLSVPTLFILYVRYITAADGEVSKTFDAGGTYVSFPWWVPMGKTLSIALGVVVGRWIGSGLLGYQPFYRKWTTDWELACQKMELSIFQRRFADRSKTE